MATVATELVFCCAVVFLSISVGPVPQHHRMHHYTGAVRRSYVILYNNRLDAKCDVRCSPCMMRRNFATESSNKKTAFWIRHGKRLSPKAIRKVVTGSNPENKVSNRCRSSILRFRILRSHYASTPFITSGSSLSLR